MRRRPGCSPHARPAATAPSPSRPRGSGRPISPGPVVSGPARALPRNRLESGEPRRGLSRDGDPRRPRRPHSAVDRRPDRPTCDRHRVGDREHHDRRGPSELDRGADPLRTSTRTGGDSGRRPRTRASGSGSRKRGTSLPAIGRGGTGLIGRPAIVRNGSWRLRSGRPSGGCSPSSTRADFFAGSTRSALRRTKSVIAYVPSGCSIRTTLVARKCVINYLHEQLKVCVSDFPKARLGTSRNCQPSFMLHPVR